MYFQFNFFLVLNQEINVVAIKSSMEKKEPSMEAGYAWKVQLSVTLISTHTKKKLKV